MSVEDDEWIDAPLTDEETEIVNTRKVEDAKPWTVHMSMHVGQFVVRNEDGTYESIDTMYRPIYLLTDGRVIIGDRIYPSLEALAKDQLQVAVHR